MLMLFSKKKKKHFLRLLAWDLARCPARVVCLVRSAFIGYFKN